MGDALAEKGVQAFREAIGKVDFFRDHGGFHAYLAYESVDAIAYDRRPATNV